MSICKAPIAIRIEPDVKTALEKLAKADDRSLYNWRNVYISVATSQPHTVQRPALGPSQGRPTTTNATTEQPPTQPATTN